MSKSTACSTRGTWSSIAKRTLDQVNIKANDGRCALLRILRGSFSGEIPNRLDGLAHTPPPTPPHISSGIQEMWDVRRRKKICQWCSYITKPERIKGLWEPLRESFVLNMPHAASVLSIGFVFTSPVGRVQFVRVIDFLSDRRVSSCVCNATRDDSRVPCHRLFYPWQFDVLFSPSSLTLNFRFSEPRGGTNLLLLAFSSECAPARALEKICTQTFHFAGPKRRECNLKPGNICSSLCPRFMYSIFTRLIWNSCTSLWLTGACIGCFEKRDVAVRECKTFLDKVGPKTRSKFQICTTLARSLEQACIASSGCKGEVLAHQEDNTAVHFVPSDLPVGAAGSRLSGGAGEAEGKYSARLLTEIRRAV